VQIEAEKPSFKNSGHVNLKNIVWERSEENEVDYYLAHRNITLVRVVTPAFWIASLVLIAVYTLIAFELMHRTLAAFLGASVLLTITYTAGSFNPRRSLNLRHSLNLRLTGKILLPQPPSSWV